MYLTITLIISFLVLVNFLLLKFSCNKEAKKASAKQFTMVKLKSETKILAPTGS